jgi:hypothetical protein
LPTAALKLPWHRSSGRPSLSPGVGLDMTATTVRLIRMIATHFILRDLEKDSIYTKIVTKSPMRRLNDKIQALRKL